MKIYFTIHGRYLWQKEEPMMRSCCGDVFLGCHFLKHSVKVPLVAKFFKAVRTAVLLQPNRLAIFRWLKRTPWRATIWALFSFLVPGFLPITLAKRKWGALSLRTLTEGSRQEIYFGCQSNMCCTSLGLCHVNMVSQEQPQRELVPVN